MDMSWNEDEIARFQALQGQLERIWTRLRDDPFYPHTSVLVPSMSVNQEELSKVTAAGFYEERLMFALIRLRNPNAKLIYLTSQPVHPDVIDYYLQLLDGVSAGHARKRLHMVSVYDSSPRPLTEKLLERPPLLQRLKQAIGDPANAYLTAYNCTPLEGKLAAELGIPLNGLDPTLLGFGTKSGNRRVFAEAGISYPAGFEDLRSEDDVVKALLELRALRPELERAVIKLNESFGGEGNAIFTYPDGPLDPGTIRQGFESLSWISGAETFENFMRKYGIMGGIVEEMLVGEEVRSPSVQMRIMPGGETRLVSSHEQVLGGNTGHAYLGCRFPANEEYRMALLDSASKIGVVLSGHGILGRFGIDFLTTRSGGGWDTHAIEINLRMGGTTPPFHALEFLTGGALDAGTGLFHAPSGQAKYYAATDNLKSTAYRGLLPEDLLEIVYRYGLNYRHASGTGVLFYMIGALSQYGKLGMTCIGDTPEEAQALFMKTVSALDESTGSDEPARVDPMSDRHLSME